MGQAAVMAFSAVPCCWEHWFCPVQGGKEERLELKHLWWDEGIVQVGCSELLGCAEEHTGMCVTTSDTCRPQGTGRYIIYQI